MTAPEPRHWILLRGLTREQAHWGEFRSLLRARFPALVFHCVDLPGTGTHFKDESPGTIAGIRERVQSYTWHIPKPVGLLGLSMGGMVALDWAQAAPEQVDRLVLVNTSSGFSMPWQRMRPGALGRALRLALRRDLAEREQRILAMTSNRPVAQELASAWFRIQRRRPVTLSTTLAQLRAAAGYRPQFEPPTARGLLLASAGDRIVHWHCSRELSRRWHWPLRVHPDAGHDLMLDDPEWVVEQFGSVA